MAKDKTRREFIFRMARIGALTSVGGMAWGWMINLSGNQAFVLRPPGALPKSEYGGACIKCGLCVEACPYRTLALTRVGEGGAVGIPRFVPRATPCYMCPDVPCARACPTGALERDVEITRSRMGLAVLVDQENCIAFQGLRCEVCYRVCPLIDKAISLQYRPQERTGVHAFFEPVVHSDSCTGCGMCEHACILEEAAIKVFPHALVQGRQGPGYRFGWKEKSGVSQDFKSRKTEPKREAEPWNDKELDHTLETLEDVKGLYD